MKITFTKQLLLLSAFLFFAFDGNCQIEQMVVNLKQENPSITKEVIFGVTKISDKTYTILTEGFKKIEGVQFYLYCDAHKLILLRYNQELYSSPDLIVKELEKQNIIFPMHVKEGDFNSVSEICSK